MAPVRSSTRRGAHGNQPQATEAASPEDPNVNKDLFIDPMHGTPLQIYIEKDVQDKDTISQLIIKHGGIVSPGYSGVPYILVDPYKASGQNLWRQYNGKKGKIILNASWIHECIKANQLQTFHSNYAGCKVTGNENIYQPPPPRRADDPANRGIQAIHPHALQATMAPVDPLQPYPFQAYGPHIHASARGMPPGQPPPWQVTIAPAQTHLHPPPAPAAAAHPHMIPRPAAAQPPAQAQQFRDDGWEGYTTPDEMAPQPPPFDYRYRDDQNGWVAGPGPYYESSYEQGYGQPPYIEDHTEQSSGSNSVVGQAGHVPSGSAPPGPAPASADSAEKPRGRKRTRAHATPAAPASSLVVNRNPPARSPTPPTRVIKSTYGGNLFTADDVFYLKKYIDYCQDQCLVLSLREICERIAVKAPHHTFYSWRRYCNKHQIRLGGYTMNHEDRSESPNLGEEVNMEVEGDVDMLPRQGLPARAAAGPSSTRLNMNVPSIMGQSSASVATMRNRSPTPPRALFRSTTGKGVAFTQEDVNFLVRLMDYRKSQGSLDMVAFWKDVATKAPHHSRASWMKFWRRHKHELNRTEGDEPLPVPPDKKMRYSKEDDVLLAKYFYNKPDGTSDKIFQAFGRLHPHHPWKGWQEHHRIHKTKIEHLMQLLAAGETLEGHEMDES
ncbi:hypothetical protein B0H34DRAFT_734307 [Crassisporium funariophilum]|nr:hypothetical protein B0H34DRAFT_734307 [Crassisporium funariophilum]